MFQPILCFRTLPNEQRFFLVNAGKLEAGL